MAPEQVVEIALERKCLGISFTYNEPSIWMEYVLDASRLGKEKGLLINLVTNGFISELAREPLFEMVDAFRVDVKGYFAETYQMIARIKNPELIRSNIIRAREQGIWVELITNLIPGINDTESELIELGKWIRDQLSEQTPWHLTRFFPAYQWSHLQPTSVERMEKALELAKSLGLKFVYPGNLPGHPGENTYCPNCQKLLIERRIFGVLKLEINKDGSCPNCGQKIPGHFEKAREGICYDERV